MRAGFVALATGLIGFAVSYSIFVKPLRKMLALPGLNRAAAERSQPAAYREETSPVAVYMSYGGGGSAPRKPDKPRTELKAPARKAVVVAAVVPVRTAVPNPGPTSLPLPGADPNQARRSAGPRPVAVQQTLPAAGTPPPPPRPGPTSWSEAWSRVAPGWITFGDAHRIAGEGVVVGEGVVLTTLTAFNASGGRGYLNGGFVSGSLLASDTSRDLALLQMGGTGAAIPISPDGSPGGGELLVSGIPNNGGYLELRSHGDSAGMLTFMGWNSSPTGGAPLVNNRGELVGLSLPRRGSESINWNVAVPASALSSFIAARPKGGSTPPNASTLWGAALRGRVTALTERSAPHSANSRVQPGAAMGNYPLGITGEQLKAELGVGQVVDQAPGYQRVLFSGPRLTFTLVDGVAVEIETDYNFYTTANGVSVGSSLDAGSARASLPGAIVQATERSELITAPGLEFQMRGNSVALLRVAPP